MSRLWYLAHPVSGDVVANCARAASWLRGLRRALADDTIIAPWIAALGAGGDDDADPAQREAGLRDCERVVERCDGLIACGPGWSTGMRREHAAARRKGLIVADLTGVSGDPQKLDLARLVAERSVRVPMTASYTVDLVNDRNVVNGVQFESVPQLCAAYEHSLTTMGRMVWAFAELAKSHSVPHQQAALFDARTLLRAAGKDVPK